MQVNSDVAGKFRNLSSLTGGRGFQMLVLPKQEKMLSAKLQNQDASQNIVESALGIAMELGIGAVTTRAVAERAGVAPSAVIYHFKSIPGLLAEVHDLAEQTLGEWRAARLASLSDPLINVSSSEALIAAIVSHLARYMGKQVLLLQELNRASIRGDLNLDGRNDRSKREAQRFWRDMLGVMGVPADDMDVWAAMAEGVLSLVLLDVDEARRDALISSAARRVADRLAGRAGAPLRAEISLPVVPDAQSLPKGKQQIIEAAVKIIGTQGVDRLTHRKVAAEAGLSLASTTYFYATKNDIIVDAFREIQRRAVQAVVSENTTQSEFISTIVLNDEGEERWELTAMAALTTAAIRSHDLRELALTLRQVRGIDGLRWLHARGHHAADHLDGIIWSAVTSPISDRALMLPKGERRGFLDTHSQQLFDRLFDACGTD